MPVAGEELGKPARVALVAEGAATVQGADERRGRAVHIRLAEVFDPHTLGSSYYSRLTRVRQVTLTLRLYPWERMLTHLRVDLGILADFSNDVGCIPTRWKEEP